MDITAGQIKAQQRLFQDTYDLQCQVGAIVADIDEVDKGAIKMTDQGYVTLVSERNRLSAKLRTMLRSMDSVQQAEFWDYVRSMEAWTK